MFKCLMLDFAAEDAGGVLFAAWDIPEDVPTWVKALWS